MWVLISWGLTLLKMLRINCLGIIAMYNKQRIMSICFFKNKVYCVKQDEKLRNDCDLFELVLECLSLSVLI